MKSHPATIIDIAKKLGVSKSTVSRALKDHPDISRATKEEVARVARELNYVPNTVATSFRYRKTKIIGLLVPQISPFFFPSVIKGVEEVVHHMGYNLMILYSNEQHQREIESLNMFIANNVEGILASVARESRNFDHYQHLLNLDIPLVFFDRIVKNLKVDQVLVDDVTASYKAVKKLIDTGRKRIAICTGNMNLLISQNRLQGYKTALIEHGIPVYDELVVSVQSPEDTETEMLKLLSLAIPPDAVFAISDLTMTGVMRAIHKREVNVPEQISVIGFCEEPFRSMYHPPLTAIEPMGFEIGEMAANLLFDRINDAQNQAQIKYLDSYIVEGGSV